MLERVYVVSVDGDGEEAFFEKDDAYEEVVELLNMNADDSGWESLYEAMKYNPTQTVEDFFHETMKNYYIFLDTYVREE